MSISSIPDNNYVLNIIWFLRIRIFWNITLFNTFRRFEDTHCLHFYPQMWLHYVPSKWRKALCQRNWIIPTCAVRTWNVGVILLFICIPVIILLISTALHSWRNINSHLLSITDLWYRNTKRFYFIFLLLLKLLLLLLLLLLPS